MSNVTANYGMLIDFIAFLGIFVYYYWLFMSEVLYLPPNFHSCVYSIYTFWYVDMSDVTTSYGEFSGLFKKKKTFL